MWWSTCLCRSLGDPQELFHECPHCVPALSLPVSLLHDLEQILADPITDVRQHVGLELACHTAQDVHQVSVVAALQQALSKFGHWPVVTRLLVHVQLAGRLRQVGPGARVEHQEDVSAARGANDDLRQFAWTHRDGHRMIIENESVYWFL